MDKENNKLISLLQALIVSQQELIKAIKEQTESNRELIEALLSEEDTEEPITTYMDGTPI